MPAMRVRKLATEHSDGAVSAARYSTSSATPFGPALGIWTFEIEANLGFAVGDVVRLSSAADPAAWMQGPVTAYLGTALTVDVTAISGAGDHADWAVGSITPTVIGDMRFGSGQSDYYRDSPEAVATAIWTRLRLWTGEWFINVTEGTPYMEAVLGTGKRELIEPALRQRILATQGVDSLENFTLVIDPDTRAAFVSATVNTIYGTASLQGAI
jgi:hypothetical protein